MKKQTILITCLLLSSLVFAQSNGAKDYTEIRLVPNKTNWTYKCGENAKVTVSVVQSKCPISEIEVNYEVGPEMLAPTVKESLKISGGKAEINLGTAKKPGFITCNASAIVDGKKYNNYVTVGFDPEKIVPTVPNPKDFKAFWDDQIKKSSLIPLNPILVPDPQKSTDKVDVYYVNYTYLTGGKARFYGVLSLPKGAGKYPAIYQVPGAGVRGYGPDIAKAEEGFIVLSVGIHGIPVDMPESVYQNLVSGALKDYNAYNLDNKESYYYNRVILGCLRGIDFIATLPQWNGKLAMIGGSQGGALSVILSGLDSRVNCLVSYYPALSDMTGYLYGRAGGWPHLTRKESHCTPEKIETISYYDVVNFARLVKVPAFFSMGYNDKVCPPTSTFSVYNTVSSPKELFLVQETAHWTYPIQQNKGFEFIKKQLLK